MKFLSGPVHAGIIEPGHFRFSVVGEKVLSSKNALAIRTRVLSGASRNSRCSVAIAWRRESPVILPSLFRGLIAKRWKVWLRRRCPIEPHG